MTTKWLAENELRAWKHWALMELQLSARLGRDLAQEGLSYPDYLVLATLSDQPDGQRRVVELADELGWEKSRASHHVTRMCERGLVAKKRCESDQRGSYVTLTSRGRKAIAAAAPGHVASVRRYFIDALSPEEIAIIDDVATRVLGRLATLDSTTPGRERPGVDA